MRKKGFTLIELLAVIVVLAVIAMITTPTVFGIIKTAKKGVAEQSTVAYVKAIESTVTIDDIYNRSYANRDDYLYDEIKADVSGSTPTGGIYALKDGIVTRGTFCVNGYKVTYSDSKAKAYENCTGDDLKWDGSLKLGQTSGFYAYPESKQINIVENTSGGKISCTSSDEKVATCSVTGTTIKIASGTKEGVSTITVKSEGNSKYKDAYAAYVATTQKGLISYTSNGYKGVYDGNLHGITVIANGFKVKYGETEGTYNLDESPKYADVGEYKVYYQISKDGYAEVKGSKDVIISQAKGNIVLEETKGNLEYNKIKKVQIKENKANNSLIVSVEDENIAQARIENNELIITGKKVGTTKITLSSSETKNYSSASTEYIVTIIKASNKIVLSSTNGTYTYPNSGTFNIASNPSGGKLSCTTSNKNVAECTISGNTVTVKPGTTKGSATLTITSAATTNYDAGKAVYVAITEPGALVSYTANGYEGVYDGNPHGITVTSSGATITYSTDGTNYSSTNPTLTNAGEMVVYYKINTPGYLEKTGSKKIIITKADGKVTPPTSKTLKYTGNAQELVNAGSSTTGQIQYKIGTTGTYSTKIPTGTDVGTYTVYYKVVGDSNHNDVVESSLNVTINPNILEYESNGYEGVYDGNPHEITVTSSGATITYSTDGTNYSSTSPKYTNAGVYTVYYRITRKGYVTVENSENIKITKANNVLKSSSNSGTYTYPNSGTFNITSNPSGGKLSCTTSNKNVAECTINGNTVTVKPGTTKGSATLTITSAATTNYNAGKAVYVAITEPGSLVGYTANGYEGVYDGNPHGITVTSSGATITYSLGIMLDSNNIAKIVDTVIDNGIYTFNNITSGNELNTFIIQLHKNETTTDKIQDITSASATGKIENEYIHEYNSGYYALKIKANGTTKDSAVWYKNIYLEKGKKYNISYEVVKNTSSQYVVKNIEIRSEYSLAASPTRTDVGTTIVYYKISKPGYSTVQGSKKIVITKAAGKVTPPTAKTLKYTGNAQGLVNAGSSTTGQIQYKVGATGTYSAKIPAGTDVGTYTVYYKVVGDSNHNDVAERSLNVTIKPTGPTKVKPTSTDTHKGIVYLDPTNLKNSCNVLNSKSGTGIKTGCMKWYIYSEDNNNYTMILDHNIEERMSYSTGMSNLTNQKLKWDNSLKVRMIQANEIAKITGNTSWSTSKGWFYLDSNNQTSVANSTNKSKYAWLYDYTGNCKECGCNIEEPESSSGYFTGTEANSNIQYIIANGGSLRVGPKSGQGFGGGIGIRPVITISKSIIS